jgi:hypothetical protein
MNRFHVVMLGVCILLYAVFSAALPAAEGEDNLQRPLRIHMLGVGEYRPVESLTILKEELEKNYRVEITTSFHADKTGKITSMPNLESLKSADVMVVFTRRMNLSEEQMAIIRNHWEQGKAIVAMRTASHAFSRPTTRSSIDKFSAVTTAARPITRRPSRQSPPRGRRSIRC